MEPWLHVAMRRRLASRLGTGAACVGALALALASGAASAQSVSAQSAPAQALPVLGQDVPLTLRPTSELDRLAAALVRVLALRLEVPVVVGEPPPPGLPEAVPSGHLALGREEGRLLLVLAGPEGQVYRSDVPLSSTRPDSTEVRAVALAVEALRDAALDGPPAGFDPNVTRRTFERRGQSVTWIYREREGGLFGPQPPVGSDAKPLFSLGAMAGLSTERLAFSVGPRVGLGLCLQDTCLMLEGDGALVPQESQSCDGRRIQYRPITLGMRVAARPFSIDDVVHFAFSGGILTRIGLASLVGVEASRLSSDFGVRTGVEVSWRFAAPLEVALEIGADVYVSPSRFVRATRPPPGVVCPPVESILVEDLVTLWGAIVLRVRP
jgi:hypothetical protein